MGLRGDFQWDGSGGGQWAQVKALGFLENSADVQVDSTSLGEFYNASPGESNSTLCSDDGCAWTGQEGKKGKGESEAERSRLTMQ